MDVSSVKDWLIPVSVFISLIAVTVKFWQASNDFRLKVQAEARRDKSAEAESDVKLVKLFAEIMNIAHGRSGYIVSEKAVELLFQKGIISIEDFKNPAVANSKIADSSIITLPVGAAAQDAAITAIAILGKKHTVLKDMAIQGLESLKHVKNDLATKYLNELNAA